MTRHRAGRVDLGLPSIGGLHGVPPTDATQTREGLHQPTRRSAGARAAATTPCWPPSGRSCRRSGIRRENTVFVSGIGCSSRFPYYLEHLRHALDPRPRAGDRDRAGRHPAGPVGVGRHRRRRRAVDRRQPPDPRAAPQRQPQDPAVQQPDLRADQGPVLADVGGREGHQVDADGLGRPPVQPDVAGAGRRGDVRGAGDGLRPQAASPRCCSAAAAHRGSLARRDLPGLPDLQRRRVRRAAQGRRDEAAA